MEAPKIALSDAELALLADASIILTKNSVIEKISQLFGELGNLFCDHCQPLIAEFPAIFQPHPKVSKGEKHQQLPWVMLDYPRYFGQEGQVAIRCFCWWGNFFSIQLQASGPYMHSILKVLPNWKSETGNSWLMGLTKDPWNMELPGGDWTAVSESALGNDIHIKLARKIPINEWESVAEEFQQCFYEIIRLLTAAFKHQYGATAL